MAGPSPEEQGCGAWGPWSPWEPCSRTCGPGAQGRSRRCSPPSLPVLRHCPGPERQTRACFAAACPGEGSAWTPGAQRGGQGLRRAAGRRRRALGPPASQPLPTPPAGPRLPQRMVHGPPGRPGPRALSRAGASRLATGNATHPRMAAGPVPCYPGALPAPGRPVSGREAGMAEGGWRGGGGGSLSPMGTHPQ